VGNPAQAFISIIPPCETPPYIGWRNKMKLSPLRQSMYAIKIVHSICRDRTKFQYTLT
jgi:hypothetical protein